MKKAMVIIRGAVWVITIGYRAYKHIKARYDLGNIALEATLDGQLSEEEVGFIVIKGVEANKTLAKLQESMTEMPW